MAEWSKALRSGRSPLCGRGFESHFWQINILQRGEFNKLNKLRLNTMDHHFKVALISKI